MSQGPLRIRRDSRENLETITPAEGEILISTDEVNEGVIHVGVSGGGQGGLKSSLRNHDKAVLKGTPTVERAIDQVSHVMALNNEWQVEGGGWEIPSRSPSDGNVHWPVIQGKLPARSVNTGGWIDFHMDGWLNRPDVGARLDGLYIRLMINNTYIGPDDWAVAETGWGWAGQGDNLSSLIGDTIDADLYFDFNMRMRCISGKGTQIVAGRDAPSTYMWKMTGEFEVYAGNYNALYESDNANNASYDVAAGTGFERHVKLIREFSTLPDVNRSHVFRLEIGSPRSTSGTSFIPSDNLIVHNASMIAHGITRGRQIHRTDIGDFLSGSAQS